MKIALLVTAAATASTTVTAFAPLAGPKLHRPAGSLGRSSSTTVVVGGAAPTTRPAALIPLLLEPQQSSSSRRFATTRLFAKKKRGDDKQRRSSDDDEIDDDDDYSDDYNDSLGLPKAFDNLDDLEAARKSFEKLWVQQHRQETVNPADLQHYYSLLQKRHEQEIRLLKRLEFSDDAVQELLKLWSTTLVPPVGFGPLQSDDTSRSTSKSSSVSGSATLSAKFAAAPPNTMLTLDADFLHAKSPDAQQDDEARQLMQIADRHPDWAEPRLRLAAYHHRRGEVLLAYEWALKGLEIQPYHFVSSTLFLLLSIQQQHDAEIEYWERMRLPTGFGAKRTAWVQRALHECHDRFESHATDIRKLLDQRKSGNSDNRPRSVVVSKTAEPTTGQNSYEQLSPMRPDVDVNSMFGGLSANNVDPWTQQHQPVSRDLHSFRKNPSASASSAVPMPPPPTSYSASRQPYDDEFNPRPNFGDDHWSNNPNGVFDIHGRVRDSPTASSSGSSASDSMSNFYQQHPYPPSSRRSSSPPPPPPSYEQLEGLAGEWE